MNYTVIWTQEAEDGLAAAWVTAADRAAVNAASHRLDNALKRDPRNFGESRASSTVRIAIGLQLGIEFEIVEDDKKVRVVRVWSVGYETTINLVVSRVAGVESSKPRQIGRRTHSP